MHMFSPFRIWVGPSLYVVVTKPEDVEILAKHGLLNTDCYLEKVMTRFLGSELDANGGEQWRKQRKTIDRLFNSDVLEKYLEEFNNHSQTLITKLTLLADGSPFDPYPIVGLCILDAVWETIIGINVNAQKNKGDPFIQNTERMLALFNERSVRPWLSFDYLYYLTSRGREQKIVEKVFRNFVEETIASRIKKGTEGKRQSFLDVLIRVSAEEGNLVSKKMTDEVCTAIATAHGTLATSLNFVLVMLGLHPDLQVKVVQELREIFSEDWRRPVTAEDLGRMDYMDRFIKETMRFFPVVSYIAPEVKEDLKLSTCTLPAGCQADILNYFTHRDPRHWPDAGRFDPDRFLPERSQGRHPYCYLPYGAGPQMSIGSKYPALLLKTVLATLLRNYKILAAVTQDALNEMRIGLVLKPVGGFKIRMIPR
ncbi:cytochrome P450 4V2 [Anabrus simplex]|uniref:cytochrome P450 4V2 n=1 Tax=Anabrus simplex TaxID=316456 RepID=UPI0035A38720